MGRSRLLGAGVAGAAGIGVSTLRAAPVAARDEDGNQHTVYDVTSWRVRRRPNLTAQEDIGAVINDIIADIKRRQSDREAKPGAAIVIPPGDYDLLTRSAQPPSPTAHGLTGPSIAKLNARGRHVT